MSDRLRRVNETLKKVISEGIAELKDPGIGFVTVTGVEATEDVREAQGLGRGAVSYTHLRAHET